MSDLIDERVSDEVEALEAILMDDVVIKRVDGVPKVIETVVHPSTGDDAEQQFVCVTPEVKHPDRSPDVCLRSPRGLDDQVIASIQSQIKSKLDECLGLPVVFELIELIRDLTESNLPSGQCAICLYGFVDDDVFIKTQCYHHFHSNCLARHLIAGQRYYREEMDKLPVWQQMAARPYQQTCPVCRAGVEYDTELLKVAPPPFASAAAPPFTLTSELKVHDFDSTFKSVKDLSEYDIIGLNVTKKLTKMDPVQAIYAESIINNVLRKGLLKKLTEHTNVCDNNCDSD